MGPKDAQDVTQRCLENAERLRVIDYWYYSPHRMAVIIVGHYGEEVVFGANDYESVRNYLTALELVHGE